jgi:D-glycero-D-manno-heptose 1,7-bisphosphate phosphatase
MQALSSCYDPRVSHADPRAAVFLDRDGVIIENRPDYVKSLAEVAVLPGALAALAQLARRDVAVIITTNQSAIGRGLVAAETVATIHAWLLGQIAAAGGRVDAVYVCPHAPEAGCACRKPAPGMILAAAADLGLDLGRSVFIGDAVSDALAARAAGVPAMLVRTGLGAGEASRLAEVGLAEVPVVADLAAALEFVLPGLRLSEKG